MNTTLKFTHPTHVRDTPATYSQYSRHTSVHTHNTFAIHPPHSLYTPATRQFMLITPSQYTRHGVTASRSLNTPATRQFILNTSSQYTHQFIPTTHSKYTRHKLSLHTPYTRDIRDTPFTLTIHPPQPHIHPPHIANFTCILSKL